MTGKESESSRCSRKKVTRSDGWIGLILFLMVMLSGLSCRKNTATDLSRYLNVADNIVLAESVFDYPPGMVLRALKDTALINHHISHIDSANVYSNPDFSLLTFIFTGKHGADSVSRAGKFNAYITGDPSVAGSRIVIEFVGYQEEDHRISGNDTLVSSGTAGSLNILVSEVTNGLIFHYDSATTHYAATRTIGINAGEWYPGTPVFHYFISGSGSGTTTAGIPYLFEAGDSLAFASSCPWALSGKLLMSSPALDVNPCIIDYLEEDGCSDRLQYDFFGNTYYLRNNILYLKH